MKIVKHISDFKHNWFKILHNKKISPLACRLQLVLLTSTKTFKTDTDRLAKQFGVSPSTLDRAISELRKSGYLKSYGKKEKCIWHVYDSPEYIDTTGGAYKDNDRHQNIDTTGGAPLYNNEYRGTKSATLYSPSEEIKVTLPPKSFEEMNEEELKKYFPF